MAQTNADNVDEAFSAASAAGSQLNGIDQFEDGTYTLKSVTTEYKSVDSSTGETVAAMSASNMNNDQLVPSNSLNNNTKLSSADAGRRLIAPYKFNKQGATVAAELSLAVTSKISADARITDTVNAADGVNALSLLDITKSNLQALSTNQNDFGYKTADKNVPVFVRVSHVSNGDVQFILEFDEAGVSADGKSLNQQKTIVRQMVLTYTFAKPQSLQDASTATKAQVDNNGAIVNSTTTATATSTDSAKTDESADAADDAAAAADLGLPPAGDDRLPSP